MRTLYLCSVCMLSLLLLACEEEGAKNAQRVIAEVHAAEVTSLVEGDIERHLEGIREAGERLARGYRVPEEQREKKLRAGLKYMLRLPKGTGFRQNVSKTSHCLIRRL